MKTRTATLPAFWAPALINGDWSGLSAEETETLGRYLAMHPVNRHPPSCSEGYRFAKYHDAQGFVKACNCLDYYYNEAKP